MIYPYFSRHFGQVGPAKGNVMMGEGNVESGSNGTALSAPNDFSLTAYDRAHMLTYARLLDAERLGHDWTAAAAEILGLDVVVDCEAAERCWRSHLERARWIVGKGLASVVGD